MDSQCCLLHSSTLSPRTKQALSGHSGLGLAGAIVAVMTGCACAQDCSLLLSLCKVSVRGSRPCPAALARATPPSGLHQLSADLACNAGNSMGWSHGQGPTNCPLIS